jgi:hypothetical protein
MLLNFNDRTLSGLIVGPSNTSIEEEINSPTYIHTYHSRLIPEGVAEASHGLKYSSQTPMFYQNDLAMRNTTDVTGSKPIAV